MTAVSHFSLRVVLYSLLVSVTPPPPPPPFPSSNSLSYRLPHAHQFIFVSLLVSFIPLSRFHSSFIYSCISLFSPPFSPFFLTFRSYYHSIFFSLCFFLFPVLSRSLVLSLPLCLSLSQSLTTRLSLPILSHYSLPRESAASTVRCFPRTPQHHTLPGQFRPLSLLSLVTFPISKDSFGRFGSKWPNPQGVNFSQRS